MEVSVFVELNEVIFVPFAFVVPIKKVMSKINDPVKTLHSKDEDFEDNDLADED